MFKWPGGAHLWNGVAPVKKSGSKVRSHDSRPQNRCVNPGVWRFRKFSLFSALNLENYRDEIFALTFYRSESCGSERILSAIFRIQTESWNRQQVWAENVQDSALWILRIPRFQTVPKSGGLSKSWGLPIIVSREPISRVIITTITTLFLQRCDLSFRMRKFRK